MAEEETPKAPGKKRKKRRPAQTGRGVESARAHDQEQERVKTIPEKVPVWPDLLFPILVIFLVTTVILLLWGAFVDAPLEEEANPRMTPNPAKAPWYFLGLQELLVYFDPWIAGVVLPNLIIIGLMIIPYIDYNPLGNGYYTFTQRKLTVSVFCLGFLLWITLIIVGYFIRGPGWEPYWPWETWEHHKVVVSNFWHLPDVVTRYLYIRHGISNAMCGMGLIGYFIVGSWLPLRLSKAFQEVYKNLGLLRYSMVMFLLLMMVLVPIKIGLRVLFNIKYIVQTPFFNV